MKMHTNEIAVDATLVKELLITQFPQFKDMSIVPIKSIGTDNAIFKIGNNLCVRLPRKKDMFLTINGYIQWVNPIVQQLPLKISTLMLPGKPQGKYPYNWGIYTWLDGENIYDKPLTDYNRAAIDLASFIKALHSIDTIGAPRSWRGESLINRDPEVRKAIHALKDEINVQAITNLWNTCISVSEWDKDPVWIHADLLPTNILGQNDKLSGIIDFDGFGVGDPAVDLLPAWCIFTAESRAIFRKQLCVDDATWMRGCGWALSIAIIIIPYYKHTNPILVAIAHKIIQELLSEIV